MLGLAGMAAPSEARKPPPCSPKKKKRSTAGVPSGLRLEEMVKPEGAAGKAKNAKKANKRLSNAVFASNAFRSAASGFDFGAAAAALADPDGDALYDDVDRSQIETKRRSYYALVSDTPHPPPRLDFRGNF